MNNAQGNYYAYRRETMALIVALKIFCVYLLSVEPFSLLVDHQAP